MKYVQPAEDGSYMDVIENLGKVGFDRERVGEYQGSQLRWKSDVAPIFID